MSNYIKVDNEEPFQTEFQYKLGEVITINSNQQVKCMEVISVDGERTYNFTKPLTRWPTATEFKERLEMG